jgi:hypothetical protein
MSSFNRALCFSILISFLLSSCGGRQAQPVNTFDQADVALSCHQIETELLSNDRRIKSLIREHQRSQNQNVAVGAVGLVLFWPALFALDLKGAAKQESDALIVRSRNLANIGKQKRCRFKTIILH